MNERAEIIGKSDINFVPVIKVLWGTKEAEKKYLFLVGIDPYGNTYFNVHQAPKVIEELERLKQEEGAKNIVREINETIEFLKKVEQHTFAIFIGD